MPLRKTIDPGRVSALPPDGQRARPWHGTIVSVVLAALAYAGGPVACATTEQVERRKVLMPLFPGHQPMLVLTRPGPTGAAIVERIERGALIELQLRPGAGVPIYECTLAGFDPANRYILITTDGATIEAVPQVQVQGLTVLGEDSRGAHIRNGLWIGGLSGLAIGAAVGAEMCGSTRAGSGSFCALVLSIPVGGLGTGVGAGIGAIAASKRARTEYPLGPGGWWIGNGGPWQPAAPPTPANIGGTP